MNDLLRKQEELIVQMMNAYRQHWHEARQLPAMAAALAVARQAHAEEMLGPVTDEEWDEQCRPREPWRFDADLLLDVRKARFLAQHETKTPIIHIYSSSEYGELGVSSGQWENVSLDGMLRARFKSHADAERYAAGLRDELAGKEAK